jgi:glycosyltransferase involved in cell wall biosynthesis
MSKGVISWFSNSPEAPTGYGQQTAQVVSRLKKDGFDVAILSNYGNEGAIRDWDSGHGKVRVYPRGAEAYSQDITPLNHAHFTSEFKNVPNALITLYDTWVLKGEKYDEFNVASWTPIDHQPVPPDVLAWCSKQSVTQIAMSRFGQEELKRHGVDAEYVPHAIEDTFKPNIVVDGQTGRQMLNISEDAFVVGIFAANKANGLVHRKALAENILAFSIFAQKHPDAVLYLHMDMFGAYGGWNIPNLLQACGLENHQIVLANQIDYRYAIPQNYLAALYSACDVYLGASYGEGFGIHTIEAQACGVPVIVSNFAASKELCGDGWLVDGQPFWDAHQRSWFNIPSVPSIVSALEQAYERPRGVSTKAVSFANQYKADVVYKTYWKPVLKKLLK